MIFVLFSILSSQVHGDQAQIHPLGSLKDSSLDTPLVAQPDVVQRSALTSLHKTVLEDFKLPLSKSIRGVGILPADTLLFDPETQSAKPGSERTELEGKELLSFRGRTLLQSNGPSVRAPPSIHHCSPNESISWKPLMVTNYNLQPSEEFRSCTLCNSMVLHHWNSGSLPPYD